MGHVLAGPYLAVAALLMVAGLAKVARPGDTARALSAAGLPGRRTPLLVRLGGGAEVVVALWSLVVGGPAAAAVVFASYLGFALFIGLALRRGWPIASCGCFGTPDRPPSRGHLVLDGVAAAVALAWAVDGGSSMASVLRHQPLAGVPLLVGAATAAGLTYLIFAYLPVTAVSRPARRVRATSS
jgi:hypothetical protein